MFSKGEGVEKNQNQSFHWLLKASNNGHVVATTNVGMRYLHGFGTERSLNLSMRYLMKAADGRSADG